MKFGKSLIVLFFAGILSLGSCSKKDSGTGIVTPPDTTHQDTIFQASYTLPFPTDTDFASGLRLGSLDPVALVEASGLCASRRYPGFLWTHNDSGNPNDIFLIDSAGAIRAIMNLGPDGNRDWEDIAIGPGPDPTLNYIYLGDIGDNNNAHTTSTIYRFAEPEVTLGSATFNGSVTNAVAIRFFYPDGPHNAETLMVDPLTKDIYVASKGAGANIYYAQYPQPDTLFKMKEIAQLPLSTLTAGDISADGSEIIMKNYNAIYYWKQNAGESVVKALLHVPQLLPYIIEQQGESLCWSPNDDAYYTTSEYANNTVAGLWKYKRK